MIRIFRAIAWLRWRTLVNSIRSGRRRDSLEEASRITALLVPILYAVMLIPSCLALTAGAAIGGWYVARSGGSNVVVITFCRVMLALATLAVLIGPLVRSMQGLQLNIRRLLLLPIPRRILHLAEMVGGLGDPWLALMIPGLMLLPVGLAAGGAAAAGGLALVAGILFLAILAALGGLCTSGVMLVFRDRRRAELLTLIVMVCLALLGVIPLVGGEFETERGGDTAHPAPPDFERMFRWAAPFPSELYSQVVAAAAAGRIGGATGRIAAMFAMAWVLYALSGAVHGRLLDSPEQTGPRRGRETGRSRAWTIPGAGEIASAVALMQARTVLRTVRGKMAVYFVVVFLAPAGFVIIPQVRSNVPEALGLDLGPMMLLAGGLLTFLSMQPVLMNQFAVDRGGLTLQFLTPASDRDLVLGKVLGCYLLALISLLLCLVASVIVSPSGSPLVWMAMLLGCVSGLAVLSPACTLVSALFPKSADLSRQGKAGNPHQFAGLLGFLLTAAALALPVGLYAVGVLLLRSPGLTFVLVASWTAVAALLGVPLMRLAEAALARRRENLYLVAAQR